MGCVESRSKKLSNKNQFYIENEYDRERPKRLKDPSFVLNKIITIKEECEKADALSTRAVKEISTYLNKPWDTTTVPIILENLSSKDFKHKVYSFVLYRLTYYQKHRRNKSSDVYIKRDCIKGFCNFIFWEEQRQNKSELIEEEEKNPRIDIQFSLLYYSSLGLIQTPERSSDFSRFLKQNTSILDQEREAKVQPFLDSSWPILQDIINSHAFANAVKLFSLIITGKDKVEESLKLARGIEKKDILWVTEICALGLTTINSRICLGYNNFRKRPDSQKEGWLLYALIHNIGHYLIQKLCSEEIYLFNITSHCVDILQNSFVLSERERELINIAKEARLESGFTFHLFLFGSYDAKFFSSETSLRKFTNPTSFQNWPVYSEEELSELLVGKTDIRLPGLLDLPVIEWNGF